MYLDFSKAFNKVDKNVIKTMLKKDKITGKVTKWLSSFLEGTVLGPVIFLIMLNDINEDVEEDKAVVTIFADDTRVISKTNTEDDVEKLQAELEKIYRWEKKNNLKFNGSKFEVLRFGDNTNLKENTEYFSP